MVEKAVLPERSSHTLNAMAAGFDFEGLHKTKQVGSGIEALRQKMEVIGHEAECVNYKTTGSRFV